MDRVELQELLKTNKLCPSSVGLVDHYGIECTHHDVFVDCDTCRELSVKKATDQEVEEADI